MAGSTPVGLARDKWMVENLPYRKAILWPKDLGIKESDSTRDMLSAKTFEDIIALRALFAAGPMQDKMKYIFC